MSRPRAGRAGPFSGKGAPWAQLRSLTWRVLLVMAAALVVVTVAGFIFLQTLPGVGGAEARARAIMKTHHEAAVMPVPVRLVAAAVSVEDEHFYDTPVVNVLSGMGRAALATVQGGPDPGGSTIEQQLAKQLYPGRSALDDIGLGVKLAMAYTHRQLIAMYLNVAYYGHGFWGVARAATGYFGVAPSRLTWAEAAMLGGLLQAPSDYDPLAHYALARARQRHVLDQLVVNHHLSSRQAAAVFAAGLPLEAKPSSRSR